MAKKGKLEEELEAGAQAARKTMVTGQLFFRNAVAPFDSSQQGEAPDGSGRKMVIVVGVLAVPKDFKPKGEHQYIVVGPGSGDSLSIMPMGEVDLTERARGQTLGGLVCDDVWQC